MMGKNVLIQMILTIFSSIVGFASLSLSARFFGPFILGHLSYVLSITGLIFAFSDLGFSKAQIYFTSRYNSASKTLATFLGLKIILLLLTSIIVLGFAWLTPNQFKGVFLIILTYELLSRFSDGILVTFEGLQQSLPQNLVRFVSKLLRLIAVIILSYQLSNVLGFSLTYLVEALGLFILSLWLIRKLFTFNYSRSLAKKYLKYSLPFFAIIPMAYLQTNSLTVLLKLFHSATEVGYYSAAFNLAGFLKILYATIMVFFFPKISSLFQKKDFVSIQGYTNLALKYLLIIFTPIFMLAFLLRAEIVPLILGPDFMAAIPVFSWLLFGMLILMLVNPYDYILYATNQHHSLVKVNLASLILTLGLSVLLISSTGLNLGAKGAALVSLIIWVFNGCFSLYLVKKRLKLSFYSKLPNFLIPAIGLIIINHLIVSLFSPSLMIKLVLSFSTTLIYLIYLLIFKLIKLNDIKYFINLLKIK